MPIRDRVQSGTGDEDWTIHANGSLRYRGRARNKKSDFFTDLSLKNRFSGGFEKICTGKNRKKQNRETFSDFSRNF